MVELHALVVKKIEVTEEQAESIARYICDCSDDNSELDRMINEFSASSAVYSGGNGEIPIDWLINDLRRANKDIKQLINTHGTSFDSIDLL